MLCSCRHIPLFDQSALERIEPRSQGWSELPEWREPPGPIPQPKEPTPWWWLIHIEKIAFWRDKLIFLFCSIFNLIFLFFQFYFISASDCNIFFEKHHVCRPLSLQSGLVFKQDMPMWLPTKGDDQAVDINKSKVTTWCWTMQEWRGSNPQPLVLETRTLPIELHS